MLLLTHADRAHLVELRWRLSTVPGSEDQRGAMHFLSGSAPEATAPIALHVPPTAKTTAVALDVQCDFVSGAGRVTTRARLRLGAFPTQTLDLGSCCDGC